MRATASSLAAMARVRSEDRCLRQLDGEPPGLAARHLDAEPDVLVHRLMLTVAPYTTAVPGDRGSLLSDYRDLSVIHPAPAL